MNRLLDELGIKDKDMATEDLLVCLEQKQIEYLDRLDAAEDTRRREKLEKTLSEIEGAINTLSFLVNRYNQGMTRETVVSSEQEVESFDDLKGPMEDAPDGKVLRAQAGTGISNHSAGGPAPRNHSDITRWFHDANEFFNKKQYDLAKVAINKVLSLVGDDGTDLMYSLAAEICLNNSESTDAMDYINKAIVANPGHPYYYLVKARVFAQLAKGKNPVETSDLIEKGRASTKVAIEVAEKGGNTPMLCEAYGCYAHSLCFEANPDKVAAEKYANKAIALGAKWGNAEQVIDQLDQERKERARIAEAQEQQKKLQKEEIERRKAAEKEAKRREERRNIHEQNSNLIWFAAWIVYLGSAYCFWKYCFSEVWLKNHVPEVNAILILICGFLCSGFLSYASFRKNYTSWVGVIIYLTGFVFCFTTGVIYAEQNDLTVKDGYWKIAGFVVALIIMHILCKKIGRASYAYDGEPK